MSAPATNASRPRRERDDADVVGLPQLCERVAQLGDHLPVQRVADLRPGDRHDGEAVVHLECDRLVCDGSIVGSSEKG
jgi:hypothetical protein